MTERSARGHAHYSVIGVALMASAACGSPGDAKTTERDGGQGGAGTAGASAGKAGTASVTTGGTTGLGTAGATVGGGGNSSPGAAGRPAAGGSNASTAGASANGAISAGAAGATNNGQGGQAGEAGATVDDAGTSTQPSGAGGLATGGKAGGGASAGVTSGPGGTAGLGAGGVVAGQGGAAGASGLGGLSGAAGGGTSATGKINYVFVIPMENHDPGEIVGNATDAPYINGTLLESYASASNFVDQFSISTPSEPHYVWMEAGTNQFSDHTFTSDSVPSASNSTADTSHLVTQLKGASNGVTWMSYQEGINSTTGACPIAASGDYVPRHEPFVFFQDVSGNPPSKTNEYCAAHHRPIEQLAVDLQAGTVATYAFITPNLCHEMHGKSDCPDKNLVHSGDAWLAANLPPLIDFVTAHAGVIFIVWDEGDATTTMPFIAIGPGVKPGYVGSVKYTHGSLLKSLEEILGVPVLSRVATENDFADLFGSDSFP